MKTNPSKTCPVEKDDVKKKKQQVIRLLKPKEGYTIENIDYLIDG